MKLKDLLEQCADLGHHEGANTVSEWCEMVGLEKDDPGEIDRMVGILISAISSPPFSIITSGDISSIGGTMFTVGFEAGMQHMANEVPVPVNEQILSSG